MSTGGAGPDSRTAVLAAPVSDRARGERALGPRMNPEPHDRCIATSMQLDGVASPERGFNTWRFLCVLEVRVVDRQIVIGRMVTIGRHLYWTGGHRSREIQEDNARAKSCRVRVELG